MLRILVTGGSGLLGSRFPVLADENYEIITTHHKHPSKETIPLDIKEGEMVRKTIKNINPDVIIHTAALTNVDYCEDHQQEAWELNVQGTKNLVDACQENCSKLIYISTDFVFDGDKGLYKEEDETNPLGYYAYTKLKGEEQVKNSSLDYVIARVSVLYGWHSQPNFVTWVLEELKSGNNINIVIDQYNSPTLADNAAQAVLRMIELDKTGLYHTAGRERISRYDFALKIAQEFDQDPALIRPIKSKDLVQKARRPADSSLSVEKIQNDLNIRMLNIKEGLEYMHQVMK